MSGYQDLSIISAMNIEHYLRQPHIQERMREYLGSDRHDKPPTARRICNCDAPEQMTDPGYSPEHLADYVFASPDLARSLADRENLLCHLDIEYVDFDDSLHPFFDPHGVFRLQEPVMDAAFDILGRLGIHPLHLISGRGHHLVWQIRKDDKAFSQLTEFSLPGERLDQHYRNVPSPRVRISTEEGRAFGTLGRVMEYLSHQIDIRSRPHRQLPLKMTDVRVGPGPNGRREIVSIDLSEYGDPLDARKIRVPCSLYLKPTLKYHASDQKLKHIVFLPIGDLRLHEAIAVMRDLEAASDHARHTGAAIPKCEKGTQRLIQAYQASDLSMAHRAFYSVDPLPVVQWPSTYDRLDPNTLPACTAHLLQYPNDLLLQPTGIRHLLINLLARGWHPRHVSGLLQSKFERDYKWGSAWNNYLPSARADFYTRLFYGAWATGLDDQVDFNCASAQEAGLCIGRKGCNLWEDFKALTRRETFFSRLPSGQLFQKGESREYAVLPIKQNDESSTTEGHEPCIFFSR